MVLVTLGGYHLLDGLVVCLRCEARKKIVRRGIVLTPREPRRATLVDRSEEQQVVRPGQVLELVRALHVGECDLRVTTSKRTGGNLGACLNGD